MHKPSKRQLLSIITPYTTIRIACVILIGWFSILSDSLHADHWKCGTPLLIKDTQLSQNSNQVNAAQVSSAPAAPARVGQTQRFFVHIPEASINATCIAVGIHCYIFIDTEYEDMLSEATAKVVADTFDTNIYPEVQQWMGSELKPGLDRDNRITILFHDVGMNESGQDYGGYFAPQDLNPTSPNSNRRDILYMDIFQFRERSRHTFFSSLTHELAHLVNWYQNGGTTDQRWLEEGIASLVEWGVYGTVHNLFVDNYLANPRISLITENTTDTYYGGAFLLLLYLYEKHGGINFIRTLADEDVLGLSAISLTLGEKKHIVDVFMKWGIANWYNNTTRGNEYGYQNLRNRRITAPTPRITSYPTTSNYIPIESWGTQYILLQNLPEILHLSLTPNTESKLYTNLAYLPPNARSLIVTPLPSVSTLNGIESVTTNEITVRNLNRNGQMLLIVTSENPQSFRYVARRGTAGAGTDIEELGKISRIELEEPFTILNPISIDYLNRINSQPFSIDDGIGLSHITSNRYPKIEPMSQIHLSSSYNSIVIQDANAFTTSKWGLEIFALSPSPVRVGEIATPGEAQAIAIDGDTAFIADGEAGVQVIDTKNRASPSIVKTLRGFQDARYVHLANEELYAVDAIRGLLVFNQQDIVNINNPHPRKTFRTAGTPFKVTTSEQGTVYLSDNAQGLYILSSDPLGGYLVDATIPLLMLDFEIFGKYALTVSRDLRIIDMDSLLNPQQVSGLNTPGITSSVKFFEGLLYLTDQHAGLQIVDVSNVQTPRLISSHPTTGSAKDVALLYSNSNKKTYAYIADGKGGIQTLDVSKPEMPIWLNNFIANGNAYALDVHNDGVKTLVGIANGIGGLKIVELSKPYKGQVVKDIHAISGSHGALCVQIEANHAYVGTDAGVDIINLMTEETELHVNTSNPVWGIEIKDGYAYLCAGSLYVVDVSEPKRSRIVSRHEISGDAYKITCNSEYAYVAALEGGVYIFDMSDAQRPQPISHFPTDGAATYVTSDESYVYVLDNRHGLLQIDIQNPQQPKLISEYTETELPITAALNANHLYLLDSKSIQILDTRSMERVTRYTQIQAPNDLAINNGTLYICDLFQLSMFRIRTDDSNLAVEESYEQTTFQPILSTSTSKNLLFQNHPNPFNPETWIPYSLSKPVDVSLSIYDVQGRLIIHRPLGFQKKGDHTAHWNGRNREGEPVASGIYFYTLNAGEFSATRRMYLQR